ncbi:MAG TPA: hypothetical protein VFN87_03415 [Solirubrobacteraceae bacterium]|nr:hypothetical protein [Solirubrobacteraceae bacterium]
MRPRLLMIIAALVCAALLAACGGSSGSSTASGSATASAGATTSSSSSGATTQSSSGTAAQMGFEGVPLEQGPLLAPASTTGTKTVNGISCASTEQLAYHIHAHLAVFDNGTPRAVPGGIGIPGSTMQQTNQGPEAAGGQCIYWLHTHTNDGIIHIESPTKRIYTLGDFFDIWRQPLSSTRIASLHGTVRALVNGKQWTKSPRAIPLIPHADIQLEIGQPTPPVVKVNWSQTQL